MENLEIKPSEELAYWVGVVQSDGCLTRYVKTDKIPSEITLGVCEKSLPMLKKFQEISFNIFKRHSKIWKTKGLDEWRFHIGVKRLLLIFQRLNINFDLFIPPNWCLNEPKFFGAYLSGLIDGDGDIRIKRPKSPQCVIRITSGDWQNFLEENIQRFLNCGVSQTEINRKRFDNSFNRFVESNYKELEFCVTPKNFGFILNFLVPYIQLDYKKEKILSYIKMRWAGFEPALRTAC